MDHRAIGEMEYTKEIKPIGSIDYEIINDNNGEVVGLIHIEGDNTYAERYSDNVPIIFGLPSLTGKWIEEPSISSIMSFIRNRVIPRNRQELPRLLGSVGMEEYDLHALIELNKGRNSDDYFSLHRKVGEKDGDR